MGTGMDVFGGASQGGLGKTSETETRGDINIINNSNIDIDINSTHQADSQMDAITERPYHMADITLAACDDVSHGTRISCACDQITTVYVAGERRGCA